MRWEREEEEERGDERQKHNGDCAPPLVTVEKRPQTFFCTHLLHRKRVERAARRKKIARPNFFVAAILRSALLLCRELGEKILFV